jgi:hypothetical protein
MKLTTSFAVAAGILSGVVSSFVAARVDDGARRSEHASGTPLIDAEADSKDRQMRHDHAIASHWAEAVDPLWATQTQVSLMNELKARGVGIGVEIERVDCRFTSCIADLRFDSYQTVRSDSMRLLAYSYKENCIRELSAPVPSVENMPYEATMIFDCANRLDAGVSRATSRGATE